MHFVLVSIIVLSISEPILPKVPLRIGVLDSSDPSRDILSFERTVPAVQLALRRAKRLGYLDGMEVTTYIEDDDGHWWKGMDAVTKMKYREKVDVVLGMSEYDERFLPSVVLAKSQTPVLTHGFMNAYEDIPDRLFNAVWFGKNTLHLTKISQAIMKTFNWRTVMLVGAGDNKCKSVLSSLRVGSFFKRKTHLIKDKPYILHLRPTLKIILETSRIVYLCMNHTLLKTFLLMANEDGMVNSSFVYFYLVMDKMFSLDNFKDKNDTPDLVRQKREIMYHLKQIAEENGNNNDNPLLEEIPRELKRMNLSVTLNPDVKGSEEALYLFDATMAYVMAVNESIKKGRDYRNSQLLIDKIVGRAYVGESGNFSIDHRRARSWNYKVWHFPRWANETIPWMYLKNGFEVTFLSNNSDWGTQDGNPPPAVPKCGLLYEKCIVKPTDAPPTNQLSLVLTTVGASMAVCILILTISLICICLFKWRREQQLLRMIWKVDYADILGVQGSKLHSQFPSLYSSVQFSRSIMINSNVSLMRQGAADIDGTSVSGQVYTKVGTYKGQIVAVKKITTSSVSMSRLDLIELKAMKELNHENVNNFVGACIDIPNVCILSSYCSRGSLQDLLESDDIQLDWVFKYSFLSDLAKGMEFLHGSILKSHGMLKSSNCLVDSRWILKIAGYGMGAFRLHNEENDLTEYMRYRDMLWTSPEILRLEVPPRNGTQPGDVFSFAIIAQEILYRSLPYMRDDMSPKDIVLRVKKRENPPFRPVLHTNTEKDVDVGILALIAECWRENPIERPTFSNVRKSLASMAKGSQVNIVDNIIEKLEKYADNLETIVEQRTGQLLEEKKKTDMLLHRMLPPSIANVLKIGGSVDPEMFEEVTIYFSDIVGFTSLSSKSTPMQVVVLLNDLYSMFDDVASRYDVYKVETIGDAYMVASGLPNRNGDKHFMEIANMSLHLLSCVYTDFKIRHLPEEKLEIRIGLHTGPCAAGVVGQVMPRYCLFGGTVNMASCMESNGEACKIHISSATYQGLQMAKGYQLEYRGEINIKGKSVQNTYWLLGKRGFNRKLPPKAEPSDDILTD